jgi:hypothetical protein
LLNVDFNTDGHTIWHYRVEELPDTPNLSTWTLELPSCASFVSASPADGTVSYDPARELNTVRWSVPPGWTKGEFTVTLKGPVGIGNVQVSATGKRTAVDSVLGASCGRVFPRAAVLSNGYYISLSGLMPISPGEFLWRYVVEEQPSAQNLSSWVLELKNCGIRTAAPKPWEVVKPDPESLIHGVKWQTSPDFRAGAFTVTTRGVVGIGVTRVAAKGPDAVVGEIVGPICEARSDDDEPPAAIVIGDNDLKHEIEIVNQVVFINISITILNTGGSAREVSLILGKEFRDLCDLIDVGFLEGKGYVEELDDSDHNLVIGVGQNNRLDHDDKVKLKLKFKAKQKGAGFKFDARFRLRYTDSTGDKLVELKPLPVVVALVGAPAPKPPAKAPAARLPADRIDARFRGLWRARGGLVILGLPLTEPISQTNGIVVQYLERARLELHPNPAGGAPIVLLGRLGIELGYATPAAAAPASPAERRWYTPETGHLIAREFRTFWQRRGGLAVFGYPIGEAVVEDGRRVQYFERTRLELHTEQAGTPYEVQVGLLGALALERSQ